MFSVNRTVCLSTAVTSLITSRFTRAAEPVALSRTRLTVATTSSASSSRPWWNFTPFRRWKVQVFKSELASQRSARSGRTFMSGPIWVSALKAR